MKKIHIPSQLLSRLSAAIVRLYAPASPSEIPGRFIETVRGLLECEHLCYNEFGANHFVGVLDPVISPDLLDFFAAYLEEHPSINYVKRTKCASAVKISDFVTTQRWQRTALYNEFFRKLNIQHQLAFMLPAGDIEIGFAANREHRDFSEVHRFLLSILAPHLTQAIQNSKAMARFQRLADTAASGGTVVFANDGKILFCSGKAADCLARFFGPIRNERLPDAMYDRLKGVIDNPVFDSLSSGALRSLTKDGEHSSLTVRFMPNHVINEHTLVLEERVRSLPPSVSKGLGLTGRQAEVLKWVSQGKTNPEIATILGISVKTVGHHVEHILNKLGVERRGGAAFLAQQALMSCHVQASI